MGTTVHSPLESTYSTGESTDVPLGEFLSRPVEIFNVDLVALNQYTGEFDPWSLFVNDPLVKRRIEGFRHLRGHLKVRFVLNGNPMMFGRYIAWYEPRPYRNRYAFTSRFNEGRFCQASQHPHVYLDPATSEGGEMTLPFFCPENFLDLTISQSVSEMGVMHIDTLLPLDTLNGAGSETAMLTVFAWMEDAQLCTPTGAGYADIIGQGLSEVEATSSVVSAIVGVGSFLLASTVFFFTKWKDIRNAITDQLRRELSTSMDGSLEPQGEFQEDGAISKTATAISRAAGALAVVPELTPYALATELVMAGVGKVASALGYSRPMVVSGIDRFMRFSNPEFAAVNTSVPARKMAMDLKNQLTVDPRTVGLEPEDEMLISNIVRREAIFGMRDWTFDTAKDAVITSCIVTPTMFSTDTSTSPNRSVLTPTAAVSQLFDYWRGTLIYRFQIVASPLHRGRLRVSYDPVGQRSSGMNEIYSHIIDLATTRDFEIPVRWHARTPFLKCEEVPVGSVNLNHGTTLTTLPDYHNGVLTLTVVNPLKSPNPDYQKDVQIIMSVRGGDDFEFAKPGGVVGAARSTFKSTDPLIEPQGNIDETHSEKDNEPVGGLPLEDIGEAHPVDEEQLNLVFFGEKISSLRQLAKRYQQRESIPLASFAGTTPRRPEITTSRIDVLEYIMSMYVGWRGSTRHVFASNINSELAMVARINTPTPWVGASAMELDRGSLSLDVPYYYNRRFSHCRTNPGYTGTVDTAGDPNEDVIHLGASENTTIAHYAAAGEDFSCFFFVGLPPLYDNQ
jgi:hypothetical protein